MQSVVVIPARYRSSRFPGKPLVELAGKPMILWVAELSARAVGPEKVYVATEDQRIYDLVTEAGFQAVMTSDQAPTGTDRLAEAAALIPADFYINVQGDEPLVDPADIRRIIEVKERHPELIINGCCPLAPHEDPENVNIPKVITNEANLMVYMSRRALPGFKEPTNRPTHYLKQVCIYAFSGEDLRAYKEFGRKSELEKCEDIEILRFLELDKKIMMVETSGGTLAVDVPEDMEPVARALKKLHGMSA